MNQAYTQARAAQVEPLLVGLRAERTRLKTAITSPPPGREVGGRGIEVLKRQVDEISQAIERLSA